MRNSRRCIFNTKQKVMRSTNSSLPSKPKKSFKESILKCSGLKRCRSKNPRFSRVFFVFRRFSHFFENRILVQIKRCQTPISTYCAESDWWNAISGRFSESFSLKKTALFSFFTKNIVKFLCLRKEVLRIVYIYKKEDCDCRYCLYDSKGKCKLQ